jgi:DNA-nicking Smr family endonuclease
MSKLKLDLHGIFNKREEVEAQLGLIIKQAMENRIPLVEIITGKGSGQLKKHTLHFLAQPEIKPLYHRVEKDSKNFGRIFVHFRHKNSGAYH